MQLTVQVSSDLALAIGQQGLPNKESQELLSIIEDLGLKLEPLHAGTDDPNLKTFFILNVQDYETAQRIADHLRQLEAIRAIYLKPPDEQA